MRIIYLKNTHISNLPIFMNYLLDVIMSMFNGK